MKELDKLMEKVGVDKFLHHIIGALICALISIVTILQDDVNDWDAVAYPTIGGIAVFIISIVKEYALDDKPDWADIFAAILGCLWVYLAVFIGVLFCTLSS